MKDRYNSSAGDIFADALDIPIDNRSAWLDENCPDVVLRKEVESLISSHNAAGDFLATPALDADFQENVPIASEDLSGSEIGSYRLVRVLGRGGMSTVYLGERIEEDFEQFVAIKIIKKGMDSAPILQRFHNERQVLAALEHPNIARLIDGGATSDGRPFIIMEYINGMSIERYCKNNKLSTSQKIELFKKVCETLQYAHNNLVVHRDLKPSNIMVDTNGRIKLLDFGIAKVLQPENSNEALGLTITALRMMTPRYASPEQVKGKNVTTATDIYSLGVVLYELLTEVPPYQITSSSPSEIEHVICNQEPTRPSDAVARKKRDSSKLNGDIDNIVMRALRKEPERRYVSPQEFAEDIRRHLEGLPVLARPNTFKYRSGKFIKRNFGAVLAAVVVAITLLSAAGISTILYIRAENALAEASTQRQTAAQVNAFLQNMMIAVDPVETQSGAAVTVAEILEEAADRINSELAEEPKIAAALHKTIANTYKHLGYPQKAEIHGRAQLELLTINSGEYSTELISARMLLGKILRENDSDAEADSLFGSALVSSKLHKNGSTSLTADALRELGEMRQKRATIKRLRNWCVTPF